MHVHTRGLKRGAKNSSDNNLLPKQPREVAYNLVIKDDGVCSVRIRAIITPM